jgi:hypothetical protein
MGAPDVGLAESQMVTRIDPSTGEWVGAAVTRLERDRATKETRGTGKRHIPRAFAGAPVFTGGYNHPEHLCQVTDRGR